MSEKGYAFACASVRAKENELLSQSFMAQLLDSDYDSCVRALIDRGIVSDETCDPSNELSKYMDATWDYLCDIAPDKNALDFMIVKNDFHNLKAILKSIVTNSSHSDYFITPCVADPNEIYDNVQNKHFDLLPKWLENAAEHAYELITTTMDGQLLDVYLDTQSLMTMRKFAMASGCEFAVQLAELQAALADIKVALRLARGNKSEALVDEAFCECESFDSDELKKAVLKGRDDVISFIALTSFSSLAGSLEISKAEFEKECDNLIISALDASRVSSFGAEPMIAYYYARENESRMLRIILSCKHIGLPKEQINERMRELYV